MNDYTAPAYTTALKAFCAKFIGERQSQPSTSTTCSGVAELNTQVLNYFWGPAEFNATGSLKNF